MRPGTSELALFIAVDKWKRDYFHDSNDFNKETTATEADVEPENFENFNRHQRQEFATFKKTLRKNMGMKSISKSITNGSYLLEKPWTTNKLKISSNKK